MGIYSAKRQSPELNVETGLDFKPKLPVNIAESYRKAAKFCTIGHVALEGAIIAAVAITGGDNILADSILAVTFTGVSWGLEHALNKSIPDAALGKDGRTDFRMPEL